MTLKTTPFSMEDNNIKDLDNVTRKYPTLDYSSSDRNIAIKKAKTVHRRRDLDSLG